MRLNILEIMKHILLSLLLGFVIVLTNEARSQQQEEQQRVHEQQAENYGQLSQDFLNGIRLNKDVKPYIEKLAELDVNSLSKALKTDMEKRAFWMNVYNGFIQYLLSNDASLYNDRGAFFGENRMVVAGEQLSFDDIEPHRIRESIRF